MLKPRLSDAAAAPGDGVLGAVGRGAQKLEPLRQPPFGLGAPHEAGPPRRARRRGVQVGRRRHLGGAARHLDRLVGRTGVQAASQPGAHPAERVQRGSRIVDRFVRPHQRQVSVHRAGIDRQPAPGGVHRVASPAGRDRLLPGAGRRDGVQRAPPLLRRSEQVGELGQVVRVRHRVRIGVRVGCRVGCRVGGAACARCVDRDGCVAAPRGSARARLDPNPGRQPQGVALDLDPVEAQPTQRLPKVRPCRRRRRIGPQQAGQPRPRCRPEHDQRRQQQAPPPGHGRRHAGAHQLDRAGAHAKHNVVRRRRVGHARVYGPSPRAPTAATARASSDRTGKPAVDADRLSRDVARAWRG